MFEPNSRYYNLETATLTTAEGEEIAYKRRRFLPQGGDLPLLDDVAFYSSYKAPYEFQVIEPSISG